MPPESNGLLEKLDRAGRHIENTILVILLLTMMLVAVGQIVLREVFDSGLIWADELVKLSVLWLAMVGSIAACRDNRHIRIDALSHLLSPLVVGLVRVCVDVFAAAVCAVIGWQAFRYLQVERQFGDTVLVNVPAWLVHGIVPFAFVLISYRFVILAIGHARNLRAKTDLDISA